MTSDEGRRKVTVDYLYLDLAVCDRCIGTDKVLESAVEKVRVSLSEMGYDIELRKTEIENADMARRYRFVSSPTIRVNGIDICSEVEENECGCCGDISGTYVECRVFRYKGKAYEVPPEEMLTELIMANAEKECSGGSGQYTMPENLRRFFEGKESGIRVISRCC